MIRERRPHGQTALPDRGAERILGAMIRRRRFLGLVTALLALAASCVVPGGRGESIHLVLLHTSDVHGQVLPLRATWIDASPRPLTGGLPRLAAAVHRVRREETAPVILVDAGDWYQGTPEGAIDLGLSFVSGLASLDYDAMCLGNHEFDHGLANLHRLLEQGGPPAVCANLEDPRSGERVPWVPPWRIVERAGLRIALVGLVTPETPDITHPDARTLRFVDPVEALGAARAELRGRADLVIPVGHVGIAAGRRLAAAYPDLPVVVTGHAHTMLERGVREGRTLIVQAGAKAAVLGRVDLWLDPRTHAVERSRARLIGLLDEPAPEDRSPELELLCRVLVEESDAELSKVAGELTAAPARRPLAGVRNSSSAAGNWIADAMRARTGADVAMHNRGGTRADLEAGLVTRRDLFELLPFDNELTTMTLTGAELEAVVRQSVEGGTHAPLDYSGLVAYVESDPPRLERVEVAGQPLDPARDYRVTVNTFLAEGGDAYAPLVAGRYRITDPILLRDLLALQFDGQQRVTPASDERIVSVGG